MKFLLVLFLLCLPACGKPNSGIHINLEPLQSIMVTTAVIKLQKETGNEAVNFNNASDAAIVIEYATNESLVRFGTGVLGVAHTGVTPCKISIADRTFTYNQDWVNAVVWHEIGHCVGMAHTNIYGDIMYPYAFPLSYYTRNSILEFFRRLHEATH